MRALISICLLSMALGTFAEEYPTQSGDQVYSMPFGSDDVAMPLWTHVPAGISKDAPVVVVMHGVRRDADRYLHQWRDLSDKYGFYLLVPEFSKKAFPGASGYNLGNTRSDNGDYKPSEEWSFTRVEEAFDFFKAKADFSADRYVLYGHSAGAQFVHRFMYLMPNARVEQYIAANAGWYTMPDHSETWPYGLRRTNISRSDLRRALSKPLLVLLGDQDIDADHPSLRRTEEAMRQGPHRLARGTMFFMTGLGQANTLNVPFDWKLAGVPGVAHDNRGMAAAAARYLFSRVP